MVRLGRKTPTKRFLLLPLGLLALGAASLGACKTTPVGTKEPIAVRVRAVGATPEGGEARYAGTLEPAARVDLAFRGGGYIESIGEIGEGAAKRKLEKGDFVKKGTILASLRPSEFSQKVSAANAALEQAKANAKLSDSELDRERKLFADKAIAKAELDAAEAKASAAKASVDSANAQLGDAQLALQDTVLRAPMDGTVLARPAEVGALVGPGAVAVTLADLSSVKAVFGAPEGLVARLQVGTPLSIYLGSDDSKPTMASVTRIAPTADTNGRLFAIEASMPNAAGHLRPGSVISVRLTEAATTATPTLVVPLSAVVRSPRDPKAFSVFTVEGKEDRGPVKLIDVDLGDVTGNGVSVSKGLAIGDRVVTSGATLLHDGDQTVVIH